MSTYSHYCRLLLVLAILYPTVSKNSAAQERSRIQSVHEVQTTTADVQEEFAYQGQLLVSGTPFTGSVNMTLQLFTNDACTTGIGDVHNVVGLSVINGIFNINMPVTADEANGQRLYLGMEVMSQVVGCEEILAVPYAIGLRPGAEITGSRVNQDVLRVENAASTGESYAIWSKTNATLGRGISAWSSASSGASYGVYGRSDSPDGAGIFARGAGTGADLILGGTSSSGTGDDGKIYSDPAFGSSDIYLVSNDNIRLDINDNNDAEDGAFEIWNNYDAHIFNVDQSGAVMLGRLGVAAFPHPAYDTDWVTTDPGEEKTRNHLLGGDVDKYVVEVMCKDDDGAGINNIGIGRDHSGTAYRGVSWRELTTTSIKFRRWLSDDYCDRIRIRIWMYI